MFIRQIPWNVNAKRFQIVWERERIKKKMWMVNKCTASNSKSYSKSNETLYEVHGVHCTLYNVHNILMITKIYFDYYYEVAIIERFRWNGRMECGCTRCRDKLSIKCVHHTLQCSLLFAVFTRIPKNKMRF